MNGNTTIAHVKYNQHIKDALTAGKPVEHDMKDFLPSNSKHNNKRTPNDPYRQIILETIKQNRKEYNGFENIHLRGSLLSDKVMKLMNAAETLEESKRIYTTYKSVIYDTAI